MCAKDYHRAAGIDNAAVAAGNITCTACGSGTTKWKGGVVDAGANNLNGDGTDAQSAADCKTTKRISAGCKRALEAFYGTRGMGEANVEAAVQKYSPAEDETPSIAEWGTIALTHANKCFNGGLLSTLSLRSDVCVSGTTETADQTTQATNCGCSAAYLLQQCEAGFTASAEHHVDELIKNMKNAMNTAINTGCSTWETRFAYNSTSTTWSQDCQAWVTATEAATPTQTDGALSRFSFSVAPLFSLAAVLASAA